jgi:ribose/xylose/arabinose/galactoside ABC-type transport system permease subunit
MRNPGEFKILAWADRYRIYLLLAVVAVGLSLIAPRFLNLFNLTVILKSACLNATVAIGFTIVMICGELDLSIGTTLTLGAMLAVGLQPKIGWAGSVAVALAAGLAVGVANGLLVTKARIHSFMATLGTLTIGQGVIYLFSRGASVSVTGASDFALADFLDRPLVPPLTPRVLITIALVACCQLVLARTRAGRNVYLVGGSREAAWAAGINPARYLIAAFALSGFLSALGGTLYAMSISSATNDLGVSALMDVIAATIIGGTAMSGGKGSVTRSAVAVLTFAMLFNGFNRLDLGSEFRILVSGVVLAAVVLGDALSAYRHEQIRGRRAFLMDELRQGRGEQPK